MSQYKGDAYLRLSYSADRSVESDSIANQKKLIEDFVAAHPDIELVSERVDDGYSGVLFERPAVQELLDQMREGKINCIIVKDFTRFGRNSIEVCGAADGTLYQHGRQAGGGGQGHDPLRPAGGAVN